MSICCPCVDRYYCCSRSRVTVPTHSRIPAFRLSFSRLSRSVYCCIEDCIVDLICCFTDKANQSWTGGLGGGARGLTGTRFRTLRFLCDFTSGSLGFHLTSLRCHFVAVYCCLCVGPLVSLQSRFGVTHLPLRCNFTSVSL